MTKPTGRPRGRPRKNTPAPPIPESASPIVEIDDLIGAPEEAAPAPAAPPAASAPSTALGEVYGGVSASWLAQVFGADKNTISKKLAKAGCPIAGHRGKTPLYLIPEAAAYLVKPKVDLVEYIKTLRPNDLPPILNVAYWDAMLKRQKWEENARDLWRTDDVLKVFGELALSIKTTINLWVEEVDRVDGLTTDQRQTLIGLTDKLLEQIYEMMIEAPRARKTASSVEEDGAMPDSKDVEPGDANEL